MFTFSKKFVLVITAICLGFNQLSFAARMGKSRSYGMQRSVSQQNYRSNSNYANYNQAPQQAQPQANRGSFLKPALLGAAAGAAGGYMLGRAMNNNGTEQAVNHESNLDNQQAERAQRVESQIPWGLIAILGLILFIGLSFFRKKTSPNLQGNNANFNSNMQNNQRNNFDIPNIRREQANTNSFPNQNPNLNNNANYASNDVMPDGLETQYFLRQVKGMFLHIQSMNNPDNITEVEKYMTAQMYAEIRQTIAENDVVADFSNLNCQLMQCDIEGDELIASVMFTGNVSDSPNSPVMPFKEIWNFIKPNNISNSKWLVSGIQQTNNA